MVPVKVKFLSFFAKTCDMATYQLSPGLVQSQAAAEIKKEP